MGNASKNVGNFLTFTPQYSKPRNGTNMLTTMNLWFDSGFDGFSFSEWTIATEGKQCFLSSVNGTLILEFDFRICGMHDRHSVRFRSTSDFNYRRCAAGLHFVRFVDGLRELG